VSAATLPPAVQRLVKALRTAPTFQDLCDALDLSPKGCAALIDQARRLGVPVAVELGHVGLASTQGAAGWRVHKLTLSPLAGEEAQVAVISDLHYGSKYCLREAIADFIGKMHARGVRHVLCPGDLLEGMYRHAFGELSHSGLEDQTADAIEHLPQHPGLHYHYITGNHEETFARASGVNVGRYIEGAFRQAGRGDLHHYGDRGAFLSLYGAVVHLWHPTGSTAYAKSYKLQRMASGYPVELKPHLLLAGHWHTFCHVEERGVQAIACPTFQHGLGPFGRSLGTTPAIGGLLLQWRMTEAGTMREFSLRRYPYYEHDVVQVPREVCA
jgi:hypothetical protein